MSGWQISLARANEDHAFVTRFGEALHVPAELARDRAGACKPVNPARQTPLRLAACNDGIKVKREQ
jgi:hypothetical protein